MEGGGSTNLAGAADACESLGDQRRPGDGVADFPQLAADAVGDHRVARTEEALGQRIFQKHFEL